MASRPSPSRFRLAAMALGLGMAGVTDLPALAQYDPLSGLPPPAPARAAPQAAGQQGGYDPYARKTDTFVVKRNDTYGVTRLLQVVDGTPRYEIMPEKALTLGPTAMSGLVSMNLHDGLPVDAGLGAPLLTEATDKFPVLYHYIVKFWETYPEAKVVDKGGRYTGEYDKLMGVVDRTPRRRNTAAPTPPPEVKARLDRQANAMLATIHAYPWIQKSQGVVTNTSLDYHLDTDPSGRKVWGFKAMVWLGALGVGKPVQTAGGRWTATCYDWQVVEICSNCFSKIKPVQGRYRGLRVMNGDILVDTLDTPLWVSEYRTGEGPKITNPQLYDTSRAPGDIQVLTVRSAAHNIGGLAETSPDSYQGRVTAAAFLTDWKRLVNEGNSPGAPRAD